MRTLIIEIDHLPYVELNPNSRCHFMVKAKAVKTSREEIGWLAKVQWHDDEPMMRARISYEFHTDNRRRDLDNLLSACKPWQDGLIDAGVIFYDDAKHLEMGQHTVITGGANKTLVKVQELATTSSAGDSGDRIMKICSLSSSFIRDQSYLVNPCLVTSRRITFAMTIMAPWS